MVNHGKGRFILGTPRDRFWRRGHPRGRCNNGRGNNRVPRMTPVKGAFYPGVRNVFARVSSACATR